LYSGEATTTRASPFKIQSSALFDVYFVGSLGLFAAFGVAVAGNTTAMAIPYAVSAGLAFGPLVLAAVLYHISGDTESPRWPFHKEPLFGSLHQSFGFNAAVGFLVGVLPVYQFATALLATCSTCA
jgi:ABC-type antimicrobial peptide transport system permease subunit